MELFYLIWSFVAVYVTSRLVYNIYFHPLSKYPGPALWVALRLPYVVSLVRGNLVHDIEDIHRHYGDIVRVAPNEISISHADGWRDIYRKAFPKNPIWWGGKSTGNPESLLTAEDPADHARMRKVMDRAFTHAAVQKQEKIIQKYVDLFVERLRQQNGEVDIVKWLNFVTFDIVGDLAFGEPFNCLSRGEYHQWVATIFTHFKTAVYLAAARFYPPVISLLMRCIPKSVMKPALENRRQGNEKIHRRLNLETERPDFMSPVIKDNTMALSEIEGTFNTLIVAGSETTATVLADPRLFSSENEITLVNLNVDFLDAVIKEGLRMCTPTPGGLARVVPAGGAEVCGNRFPEGTHISVHSWSMYRSSTNFHEPLSFLPGRWLGEARDNRHALQPFSMGPRNCLGKMLAWAELRLILARLVWNFDITPASILDWDKQKTYVLVEKLAFAVQLSPRN